MKTKHTQGIMMSSGTELIIMPSQVKITNSISGQTHEEAIVNAERITKCWNMHDELLEALEWFCNRVDNGEVRSKKTYARYKELIKKATE